MSPAIEPKTSATRPSGWVPRIRQRGQLLLDREQVVLEVADGVRGLADRRLASARA